MRIAWIKRKSDNVNFILPKSFGMNVYEIEDLEKTDEKIEELIKNKCNPIIISNELAGFSESIIKRYSKDEEINIIIAKRKE